jgi:peptidoglycan/LPS O-acetylase OafA/YrhL
MGVDLFFVLSGFLISGLLFQEYKTTGTINFRRFFIRRGFKIYPAYMGFIVLTLPLAWRYLQWADLTLMQAYFPYAWRHGWSLSVEEHFYIALPLLLIFSIKLVPRNEFAWIVWAFPVVAIGCLALRLHAGEEALVRTHLRFDSLFAGVTLGWLYRFRTLRIRRKNLVGAFGAILVCVPFLAEEEAYAMYTFGFSATMIGFACILVWALNTPAVGKLKPLALIGAYSYSIYLWHMPVAMSVEAMWPNRFVPFWTYVLSAIVFGIGMANLIEMPALRFRDRMFPRQQGSGAPACAGPSTVAIGEVA